MLFRSPSFAPSARHASRWPFGLVAIVAFGSVGAALASQYAWDMQPCPWCVLQRLVLVVMGVLALVGLALGRGRMRVGVAVLEVLLACAGFAAAMWQHFVAAASASCNLTLADRLMTTSGLDRMLPQVFEARASCADAAVSVLGVPYDFLAAAAFVVCAVAAVRVARGAA